MKLMITVLCLGPYLHAPLAEVLLDLSATFLVERSQNLVPPEQQVRVVPHAPEDSRELTCDVPSKSIIVKSMRQSHEHSGRNLVVIPNPFILLQPKTHIPYSLTHLQTHPAPRTTTGPEGASSRERASSEVMAKSYGRRHPAAW